MSWQGMRGFVKEKEKRLKKIETNIT